MSVTLSQFDLRGAEGQIWGALAVLPNNSSENGEHERQRWNRTTPKATKNRLRPETGASTSPLPTSSKAHLGLADVLKVRIHPSRKGVRGQGCSCPENAQVAEGHRPLGSAPGSPITAQFRFNFIPWMKTAGSIPLTV